MMPYDGNFNDRLAGGRVRPMSPEGAMAPGYTTPEAGPCDRTVAMGAGLEAISAGLDRLDARIVELERRIAFIEGTTCDDDHR